MDIRQFRYFIEVVKCQFNLSLAAKKLYISQPALSQFIKAFEQSEQIQLFERYKGRLQQLTPAGEIFYENAKKMLIQYNGMLDDIRDGKTQLRGRVRIGIPPLILGVVFADVIAQLIINHPDIEFVIIEKGAYELSHLFMMDELDFAILLDPTHISDALIEKCVLQQDELSAFMNKNHPLAQKDKIDWRDLNHKQLAILDPSFIIHHQLQKKFDECGVVPKKSTMSASWDFLMLVAQNSELITVLPSPVHNVHVNSNIIEKHFTDPISWTVLLCRAKKERYNRVEHFVFDFINAYFNVGTEKYEM